MKSNLHTFSAILTRNEKQGLRAPGRMIEVQGRMMHLLAAGTGGPTVVLETGASGYFGAWEWVQQQVAQHTRVISYDRAGLGFSQSAAGKRDAATIARELHELLSRAGEKPPYILVGHSYGGLLVMKYAHLYPETTAGLVLVDPSHPDQIDRNSELRKSMRNLRRFFHFASIASHLGLMHLTDILSRMTEGLSDGERARGRAFFASARHLKSAGRELDAWRETADQTRSIHFGELPLNILSADEPPVPWVKDFQIMHEEMVRLSTRGSHRIIPGVEHLNLVTSRNNSVHVTRAILEAVDQSRTIAAIA
jgi:pimeloyl-ACP methyl ester carboxylesterase